jgi:hypothetical protein
MSALHSASGKDTPWFAASGWPKAVRLRACFTASSRQYSANPRDCAAKPARPPLRKPMAAWKPRPTSPITWSPDPGLLEPELGRVRVGHGRLHLAHAVAVARHDERG